MGRHRNRPGNRRPRRTRRRINGGGRSRSLPIVGRRGTRRKHRRAAAAAGCGFPPAHIFLIVSPVNGMSNICMSNIQLIKKMRFDCWPGSPRRGPGTTERARKSLAMTTTTIDNRTAPTAYARNATSAPLAIVIVVVIIVVVGVWPTGILGSRLLPPELRAARSRAVDETRPPPFASQGSTAPRQHCVALRLLAPRVTCCRVCCCFLCRVGRHGCCF